MAGLVYKPGDGLVVLGRLPDTGKFRDSPLPGHTVLDPKPNPNANDFAEKQADWERANDRLHKPIPYGDLRDAQGRGDISLAAVYSGESVPRGDRAGEEPRKDGWSPPNNWTYVQSAIDQRATFLLATDPEGTNPEGRSNLKREGDKPAVFAEEIAQLKAAGYTREGDYLVPPKGPTDSAATAQAPTEDKPAGDAGDEGDEGDEGENEDADDADEHADDEDDSEDGKDKSNEQGDKDRIGEIAIEAAENDPPTDSGGQAAHELGSAIATAAQLQHEIAAIIEATPRSEHSPTTTATYPAGATWGAVGPAPSVTSLDPAGGDARTDQAPTPNQLHAKVDQLVVAWQDVAAWSSAVSKGDEIFHELSADQAEAIQGEAQEIATKLEEWNSEQQEQQTFAHVEHAPPGHSHGEAVHAAGGAVDPGVAAAVMLAATIQVAAQVIDVFNSLWAGTAEDK